MPKQTKIYHLNGYAGLVEQHKNRVTGTLIGLYHGIQSGIDSDPETPWVTMCEKHSNLVSHSSLKSAKAAMGCPDWCPNCNNLMNKEPEFDDYAPDFEAKGS